MTWRNLRSLLAFWWRLKVQGKPEIHKCDWC